MGSDMQLHRRKDSPAIKMLLGEVERAVGKAWKKGLEMTPHSKGKNAKPKLSIKEMWMNILGSGDSHSVHKHGGAIFAGVYYVRAPAKLVGSQVSGTIAGALKFRDPRQQTGVLDASEWFGMGSDVQVAPQEGLLLLWPGWVDHYVEPLDMRDGTNISAD